MSSASPGKSVAAIVLALGLVLRPVVSFADDSDVQRQISSAVSLYDDLEYERALEQLAKARPLAVTRDDQVALFLLEGIILADLGRPDPAGAAFRAALALDPDARLPMQVSPKVVRDFEGLREDARKSRVEDPPPDYLPRKELAEKPPSSGPRVVPWVLGGVAVAAAGTGGVFGLQSSQAIGAARQADFQDQTVASLQQAEANARVANVLFAVAGAAVVSAVVTWFATAPAEAQEDQSARIGEIE